MKMEITIKLVDDAGEHSVDETAVVQIFTMACSDHEASDRQKETFLNACDQVVRAEVDEHLPAMYDRLIDSVRNEEEEGEEEENELG